MNNDSLKETITNLIRVFENMALIREAMGDPAAVGIRVCQRHLKDYLKCFEQGPADA